jgi:hypothetical protein
VLEWPATVTGEEDQLRRALTIVLGVACAASVVCAVAMFSAWQRYARSVELLDDMRATEATLAFICGAHVQANVTLELLSQPTVPVSSDCARTHDVAKRRGFDPQTISRRSGV